MYDGFVTNEGTQKGAFASLLTGKYSALSGCPVQIPNVLITKVMTV
jgi:hypothetical protein